MRKLSKRLTLVALVIMGLISCSSWWAVQQTKHVPDFYARATQQGASTHLARERLDAEVRQLQKDVARLGSWRAAFSDQQINAWLAEELPAKFPRLARCGAKQPRIMIDGEKIHAAVQFQHGRIDTVISCEVNVELTQQPNMIALRLSNLRAGALPLPLQNFLGGITREAARGGLDVRWDMTETGPIALVTIPSEDPRYVYRPAVIETVNLVRGAMYLSGHAGDEAVDAFMPSGPLHQFVSYKPGKKETLQVSQLPGSSRSEIR
ncbi:hypothetical protein Pla22_10780 [Rubripirellula amarantea]|uniref:Uncharacterized protein n=1 Tax=Rubripirellula amarantea TaxID=2527999 RepID=A0A5C5WTE4_9BACT|nr:hypothetical protein [Rubripirellula amarantea]TWT53449.1 hypothetical protein Pla22_10780 [Rubripirellula amarantea]